MLLFFVSLCMTITIFTDGSARTHIAGINNGCGPGGWGAILKHGEYVKEISGGFRLTTNNRMELTSVIEAIKRIKTKGCQLDIYSDSAYVVNAVSKGWVDNWRKTNYKGKKNDDLWRIFQDIRKDFTINMIWVKGHANNPGNNRCDELATAQSAESNRANWLIDEWYEANK